MIRDAPARPIKLVIDWQVSVSGRARRTPRGRKPVKDPVVLDGKRLALARRVRRA
jgi:hypothetical protein